ncbi:MAG: class I SAM-dependent methyltransferase [Nanoarchaeota archaeon]|nr:class I SAM-dependent methyltransferase [Nanoarchaeota archaeon]
MQNQRKLWDKIAPDWSEFKTNPGKEIINFLKEQKGKILDLGSGAGRYLTEIKEGKMYLVDFSKEMIKHAKKRAKEKKIPAEFFVASSDSLPFEDDFFDTAISIAHLHCVETEEARLNSVKELYRVLKPNAKAKIAVWNKDSKRFKNSPKDCFVGWRKKGKRYYYLYNAEEVYNLFKNAGFKIKKKFTPDRMITFVVQKP